MKAITIITIFCLLVHCYACTRTLIRSEENDLKEPIVAGKARSVTDRTGQTYDLTSPNIYSVSDDTLHLTLKKKRRIVGGPQQESIPLADIESISVNNPTGTIFLLAGFGIGFAFFMSQFKKWYRSSSNW